MEKTEAEGVQCACRQLLRFVRPSEVVEPLLVVHTCSGCKAPVTKIWYPAVNPTRRSP